MKAWGIGLAGVVVVGLVAALVTARLHAPDYSNPRAAAKTFYIALMRNDAETARAAVCDAQQAEFLEDLRTMAAAILAARDAAVARFGDSGKGVTGGLPSLKDIDAAAENLEGEQATLTANKQTVRLRRVAGQWKVDLFGTFALKAELRPMAHKAIQAAAQAVTQKAKGIREGQYPTAAEAETAVQEALQRAMATAMLGEMLKGLR